MPHFKSPDNKIHFLDDASFINLLPAGSIQITDAEVLALQPAASPNALVLEQIATLEATITIRRIREAAASQAGKDWMIALDAQIAALRAQLV